MLQYEKAHFTSNTIMEGSFSAEIDSKSFAIERLGVAAKSSPRRSPNPSSWAPRRQRTSGCSFHLDRLPCQVLQSFVPGHVLTPPHILGTLQLGLLPHLHQLRVQGLPCLLIVVRLISVINIYLKIRARPWISRARIIPTTITCSLGLHLQCLQYRNHTGGSAELAQVGFNAGHSACLLLLANPRARLVAFDLCEHGYARPCAEALRRAFGVHRVELVAGPSGETWAHADIWLRSHARARFRHSRR